MRLPPSLHLVRRWFRVNSVSLRRGLVVFLAVAASTIGVLYAIHIGCADDAGRGGSVAVALALFFLFIRADRDAGEIENSRPDRRWRFKDRPVPVQINILRDTVVILLDRTSNQNFFLAFVSVQGTLIWGFGDLLASYWGAPACC